MLFLLLLQGPGIEPCKSALKLDTLTTDPLGTIYITVEISRSDKASVGGESLLLSYCCCPLSYFFQLQGWGYAQVHLFEAPSLTFYINDRGVASLSPYESMLFPLILQRLGIESWKSVLKLDTLTTDPMSNNVCQCWNFYSIYNTGQGVVYGKMFHIITRHQWYLTISLETKGWVFYGIFKEAWW